MAVVTVVTVVAVVAGAGADGNFPVQEANLYFLALGCAEVLGHLQELLLVDVDHGGGVAGHLG